MNKTSVCINIGNKIVNLTVGDVYEYISSIDVDDLLRIDHSNIMGELLTFPVVLNRIGLIKADAEDEVRHKKFALEIFVAQESETNRRTLRRTHNSGDTVKVVDPTKDEVSNSVINDPAYQLKKKELIKAEKHSSYMESIYWAAVSKDKKLEALQKFLTPEEMESSLVEGTCNGISIKINNKKFRT